MPGIVGICDNDCEIMKYRERYRLGLLALSVVAIIAVVLVATHVRSITKTPTSAAAVATAATTIAATTNAATNAATAVATTAAVEAPPLAKVRYEATMRNCLGRLCYDEAVVSGGGTTKVDRVGLLAFPHSGGDHLLHFIGALGERTPHIDLTHTTNVPPYGYGKNHGWSRIVRLSRDVFDHALELTNATTDPQLLGLQVKQIVRWHCRLSHVAAHTKLLTVYVEELVARPAVELEKVLTFVGVKYDRPALLRAAPGFAASLAADLAPSAAPGAHPSWPPLPPLAVATMVKALEDELQHTDNLAAWPCPSFRRLDSHEGPKAQLPVSAATSRLPVPPDALAANCSAPHVTCSVGFDRQGG